MSRETERGMGREITGEAGQAISRKEGTAGRSTAGDGLRLRFACPADIPAVRQLWDACFAEPGDFNAFFFQELYRPAYTLLLEQNGTLCAMTQMLPCHLRLTGEAGTPVEVTATYIYGACTAPAYRRRGYMATLLRHSFACDERAGRAASLLIPAEPWLFDFYRPFGYQPFFMVERHTVPRVGSQRGVPAGAQTGSLASPQGDSVAAYSASCESPASPEPRLRRLTLADIPALSTLYDALPSPCLVCRTPADWAILLRLFDTTGKGAYGWFAAGQLTAYAFCWMDNAQEAIGLTPPQEQELLRLLGRDSLTYTTYGQQTPPTSLRGTSNPGILNPGTANPGRPETPGSPSDEPGSAPASVVTQSLGCIRWYPGKRTKQEESGTSLGEPWCPAHPLPTVSAGYMNLMLN